MTALSRDATSAEVATKYALLAEPGGEIAALEELRCDGVVLDQAGRTLSTTGFPQFVARQEVPA